MKEQDIATELIRRGFGVVNSPNGGLQVEKRAFWGGVTYNTKSGYSNSWLNKRTWLLLFVYLLGLIGMVYWYAVGRDNLIREITNLSV